MKTIQQLYTEKIGALSEEETAEPKMTLGRLAKKFGGGVAGGVVGTAGGIPAVLLTYLLTRNKELALYGGAAGSAIGAGIGSHYGSKWATGE